jgi:hypothetical protein
MLRLKPSLIAIGDESTRQEINQFEKERREQQALAEREPKTTHERIGLTATTTATTTATKKRKENVRTNVGH